MSGYRLLSLEPAHLEKVISKMQARSYFRLQQTCKDLEEFIRTSKNITVSFKELIKCRPIYDVTESSWKFKYNLTGAGGVSEMSVKGGEGLHGIRMGLFNISIKYPPTDGKGFELICQYLKSHRIRCIQLYACYPADLWAKEQLVTFMEILKPETITLSSRKSDRYETIFLSKTLKEVSSLSIDEEVAPTVAEKLLAKNLSKIAISFGLEQDSVAAAVPVLRVLFSKPWPNLQRFQLTMGYNEWRVFSKQEIEEQLGDFKVTAKEGEEHEYASATIELPQFFPQRSTCHVRQNDYGEMEIDVNIHPN